MSRSSLQLLKFHQISKQFGPKLIFENFSLSISRGERIAMIGDNGSGKTTLAKLAAGLEVPDQGVITKAVECTVGYLPQGVEEDSNSSFTLEEYFLREQGNLDKIAMKLRELEKIISSAITPTAAVEALEQWDQLHQRYIELNGYTALQKAKECCRALGLDGILQRRFSTLSGGEQRRAGLAALLLKSPDLLILDEPTNHLDHAALEWLETYLSGYQGALLMISHDRTFLNRTANGIIELSIGKAPCFYAGNYDAFLATKQRALAQQFEAFQKQKEEISSLKQKLKEQTFSCKKPPPCKDNNKMAYDHRGEKHMRSKKRVIEQAKCKLDNLLENKLEHPIPKNHLGFCFNSQNFEVDYYISLEKITIIVENKILLAGVDFSLQPGSRIILDGGNGSGKSTLLRLLAEYRQPNSGTITYAPQTVIGHLDQETSFVDLSITGLEYLQQRHVLPEDELRSRMSQFGVVEGRYIKKPIGTLSFGQKRRLQLLDLMLSKANVLLLDEPTNHLAPHLIDELEEALISFKGSVIAATHDRCFAAKIGLETLRW